MESVFSEVIQRRHNFQLATGKFPTELRGDKETLTALSNELVDGTPDPAFKGFMLERCYGMTVVVDDDLIGILVL
jgi:hypothetical protein